MPRQTAFMGDRHGGTHFSHRRQVRARVLERSSILTTRTRTETSQPTPSMLFYLVSVGLVAAVVTICFGLAAFQLLKAEENTLSRERPPSAPVSVDGEARATNKAPLDRAVPIISTPAEHREQLFQEFDRYQRGSAGLRRPYGH